MLFLVTLGLANVGAIFERRSWVFGIEFARLATIAVAASVFIARGEHSAAAAFTLIACFLSAIWLLRLRSLFVRS